jgi:phospholipase C
LAAEERIEDTWDLSASSGWYGISIGHSRDPHYVRRLAGHLENGVPNASDPAMTQGFFAAECS